MVSTRRSFLALLAAASGRAASSEISCDVAILGGGVGGTAAALAALRLGMSVTLTETTDWVGGQLTSQGVPPDEHPWIESFGSTRLYREYRSKVRARYRRDYPLTAEARAHPALNPGNGSVSRLTHEPRVSLAVLESLLAPHLGGGRLTLLLEHHPVAADVDGDRVRAVRVRSRTSGAQKTIRAQYFLDATELGDLLAIAGVEHVVGAEAQRDTGEPHAPSQAQPDNHQAFTVCFAVSHHAGEDHSIDRPADYAFWRDYTPPLRPPWPGKLLAWPYSNPVTLEPRELFFDPTLQTRREGSLNLWLYRRIADKLNFLPGSYAGDICLVNWPQNDYLLGNLFGGSDGDALRHLEAAKQLSLSLLYWMQTAAPRPDGGAGWPGLRLRGDVMGTEDGLAKHPYVRESRRIRAEVTILEQHVGTEARMAETGLSREEVAAASYPDSVGVGSYRLDLHPSTGGDNYIDVSSLPFQIPLGALLPVRMENVLPAAKNLGVTHITNGCYRLHPVEWGIGEAAGALAAEAIRTRQSPRAIRADAGRLRDFQRSLESQGFELAWPRLTPR
ncbi:MAG: FAD-dependent oxidoreductase [Acidobacteria bacterium]|nr:FAD-dependent oxidoreductase [Acidobacteriota bacterium]